MTPLPPGSWSITWSQQRQRTHLPRPYVRTDAEKPGPGAGAQECHGESNQGRWLSRWLYSLGERGNSWSFSFLNTTQEKLFGVPRMRGNWCASYTRSTPPTTPAAEKTGRNRPWKTKPDFYSPRAATTTNLRLHLKCPDNTTYGYILKWLDAHPIRRTGVC